MGRCVFLVIVFLLGTVNGSALDKNFVIEKFKESISRNDLEEMYHCLVLLEDNFPEHEIQSRVIQGFMLGAVGRVEEGRTIILQNLIQLKEIGYSEDDLNSIYHFYESAANFDENCIEYIRCGGYQPTGIKIKYWLGVGSLCAGVLFMPFNPGAAAWLLGTGTSILADTIPEMFENKENYERGLPPYRG